MLGDRLAGILTLPAFPGITGVVVITGGPQYRVGSHRQFVSLARQLASNGYPVLRFDYRGMGDSEGEQRGFDAVSHDIAAAIDVLQVKTGVRRTVLWGLCDGASAALMYLDDKPDRRIAGLVLLNPWVRSQASLARTHVKHYYVERLRQRDFWAKAARGGVLWQAFTELLKNVRLAFIARRNGAARGFQQRMAAGWNDFEGPVLLLLSELDYTAREFTEYSAGDDAWKLAMQRRPEQRVILADADHTCSSAISQRQAEDATIAWLARALPEAPH
jgi:exosortase A-associated hydrolase 1